MSWLDRIKEAAYTSPSGVRATFDYENVSRSFDKKTSAFEFPDANGTFVQDLGSSGRRYPLIIFFWGDNYDLEANVFEALLGEIGVGKLEHPIYGTVDVVPFGTIKRRDDLKTAANQAIIEVTFFDTIGLVYPSSQTDPSSAVITAVDEYNTALAEELGDVADLTGPTEKSAFGKLLDSVKGGLRDIADAQEDVNKQFNAIYDSIDQSIDILVSQPLTLALQTAQLIQSPARALTSIQARLDAYGNLLNSIITGDKAVSTPTNGGNNEFRTKDLYASTYTTGSILSSVNNEFETKSEAISAAEFILNQFQELQAWRDDNLVSLSVIDTGGSYQQLQEAIALTAGFLVQISFSLKQEVILVLDRDRTMIDLVAELYGSIDDELDFFINSNNLTGSEILELPKGREIVYYI